MSLCRSKTHFKLFNSINGANWRVANTLFGSYAFIITGNLYYLYCLSISSSFQLQLLAVAMKLKNRVPLDLSYSLTKRREEVRRADAGYQII